MITASSWHLLSVLRKLRPNKPSTPPNAPSGLSASEVTDTSAKITWKAVVDYPEGVKQYEIYRDGASQGVRVGTSFADSGLSAGTTYEYQIKAIGNNDLESDLSVTLEVTTELGDG